MRKAFLSHTKIFIDYYKNGFWADATGCSGPNSAPKLTPILRGNLQQLLQQLQVRSLLDAACGDANLMRHLDIRQIRYYGLDCVPDMIESNRQAFSSCSNMQFILGDLVTSALPEVDLILCRDVLHYLPVDLMWQALRNFKQSGSHYLLVSHNLYSSVSANCSTEVGVFRPVNLCEKPFYFSQPLLAIAEDVYAKELALWDLTQLHL
jgi:SAM-dependent methyltransferase